MVITSAFQADDEGSIPFFRLIKHPTSGDSNWSSDALEQRCLLSKFDKNVAT